MINSHIDDDLLSLFLSDPAMREDKRVMLGSFPCTFDLSRLYVHVCPIKENESTVGSNRILKEMIRASLIYSHASGVT